MTMLRHRTDVALDPYWIDIDVFDELRMGEETISFPIFLPHELLGAVFACGPAVVKQVLLGGSGYDCKEWPPCLRCHTHELVFCPWKGYCWKPIPHVCFSE